MKKLIQNIFAILLLVVVFSSCTEDLPQVPANNNNWKVVVQTDSLSGVKGSSVVISGTVGELNADQIVSKGFCWDTLPNPTTEKNISEIGNGIGFYNDTIEDLLPEKLYYVRAFAKTDYMSFYGDEKSFTTLNGMPKLDSLKIFNLTQNSASVEAKIIDDGGFEIKQAGICWSSKRIPTLEDKKYYIDTLSDRFAYNISDLKYFTRYYVRAFAINNSGISYSAVDSLIPLSVPKVETELSSVDVNEVSCWAELKNIGTSPVTKIGVCYGTSPIPTIYDKTIELYVNVKVGGYSFFATIKDLEKSTNYYIRSFAVNDIGIAYGSIKYITTQNGIISSFAYNTNQITETSANLMGEFRGAQDLPSYNLGVYWGKNSNPDEYDNVYVIENSHIGYFNVQLNNLEPNTRYYFRAYAISTYGKSISNVASFYTNDLYTPDLEFVSIDGGSYMMGNESSESDEGPVHEVQISSFQISTVEVSINQYIKFLKAELYDENNQIKQDYFYFGGGAPIEVFSKDEIYFRCSDISPTPDCPVTMVPRKGAIEYCKWIGGRLPTEAEWEFAASGGKLSQHYTYSGSNILDNVGWYGGNSDSCLHPVASKLPNELGLYDMTGNVLEYCSDSYDPNYYQTSPVIDPKCIMTGDWPYIVTRGGSWDIIDSQDLKITNRYSKYEGSADLNIGFRVVKDL